MQLICISLFIVLFLLSNNAKATLSSNSAAMWGFAEKLLQERAYFDAAGEFQRFSYYYPADPRTELAEFLVAYCHARGAQYQRSNELLSRFIEKHAHGSLNELAMVLSVFNATRGSWNGVDWNALLTNLSQDEWVREIALYQYGWCLLQQGRWDEGKAQMSTVAHLTAIAEVSAAATQILQAPSLNPPPVLVSYKRAMHLSKVLPGAGQWSQGQRVDGIKSFLVNAGVTSVAYKWWCSDFRLGAIFLFYQGTLRFYKGGQYNAGAISLSHNEKEITDALAPLSPKLTPWNLFENVITAHWDHQMTQSEISQ